MGHNDCDDGVASCNINCVTLAYQDSDGDSYGNALVSTRQCDAPVGYVLDNTDCDDNNIAINPGATEICGNGIDEDCSGADLICAPLSLAAYYSFDVDETATGLITDDSGNLNTATCGPAGGGICPTFSATGGPDGSGYYNYAGLDSNVYLTAGTGSDFETLCVNGCTFSAWANSTIDGDSYILGRWDNSVTGGNANEFFYLRINLQEDTVFFFDNDGNTTNSCAITYTANDILLNQWYNYAGVWNPSTSQINLYRNGTLLASQTCLFSSVITGVGGWGDSETTFIGTVDDGSIRNEFNGAIDEVRFYNRALSPAEILDL